MKNLLIISVLTLFSLCGFSVEAQEDVYIKEYLERLENSRKYVLKVAELLPEEKYNSKVTPESMSFAENLLHIGYAMDWHSQSLLGGRKARVWQTDTIFKTANKSKKEMIKLIDETFDETIRLITSFDTNKLSERLDYFGLNRTKRQILMLLTDHITHHRGQMLVTLKLNGITPPRYVLYQ
ncbi:DinB family protein [uncultured Winogradskyella sp.]|uniref:DinB family protein n=1 Tax=uncultured Winogradskyella sp. TaxID=395353 RepID=UPI00262F40E7|nr:DinB family protein [uncultured Winogradskyella sp.]